jgi:predicted GNAT superfamily acetyltransferase
MANGADNIVIRELTTLQDLQAMQTLEELVWQMDSPLPLHQTLTVAKNGGIVLGAFQRDLMIGMLYSFPGYHDPEIYICSHMLGIREGWRHRGLGERLKQAQAELAKNRGCSMITWTYDPLETANGYLNIGKLGAVCSTYIADCYGDMPDAINQGLPSDRFQVEWWIHQPKQVLPQGVPVTLLQWQQGNNRLPQPVKSSKVINPELPVVSVAVPADFQKIKRQDNGLAKAWREITRQVFTDSFAAGWVVADFRKSGVVHEYLLCKRRELVLPQAPWKRGE